MRQILGIYLIVDGNSSWSSILLLLDIVYIITIVQINSKLLCNGKCQYDDKIIQRMIEK